MEELFEVTQMTRIVVLDSHRYLTCLDLISINTDSTSLLDVLKAALCLRPIHPKFKQQDEIWQNIVLLLDDSQYDIDAIPDALGGAHHHPKP